MASNWQLNESGAEGSAERIKALLQALPDDDRWVDHPACTELIQWLYTVVRHRVRSLPEADHLRADVAQDAMSAIYRALHDDREQLAKRANPAATLERISARAVDKALYTHRMRGFSGVAVNGRNWRKSFPRISGAIDVDSFEAAPLLLVAEGDPAVRGGERVATWAIQTLGVRLTAAARDATIYVLDRLLAGMGRTSLVRGGYAGLANDPALRHLGLPCLVAGAFGGWLLGRPDRDQPGVVDAALFGVHVDRLTRTRWAHLALRLGLAEPIGTPTPPSPASPLKHEWERHVA